jgi:hypothetical protein
MSGVEDHLETDRDVNEVPLRGARTLVQRMVRRAACAGVVAMLAVSGVAEGFTPVPIPTPKRTADAQALVLVSDGGQQIAR